MPSVGRIQATDFQALLQQLGVNPNNIPFDLRSEVTPVVLVGGTVSFVAAPTPAYQVADAFTAGVQVAPAAGFVMADTGPLPEGAYTVTLVMTGTQQLRYGFQWRDAANAVNLWSQEFRIENATQLTLQFLIRLNLLTANERFRLIAVAAGTAAEQYQATILARI